MNAQRTTILLLVFSIFGFVLGYSFSNPRDFGICDGASVACYNLVTNGFALYFGMGALAVVFLALLFVPKAWGAWKKFAVWFVPLAALLFIFYPDPGSGDYFSPYPETVYKWVSGMYLVISLVIIGLAARGRK